MENPDLMTYKYKKLRALQGKGSGNGVRGRMGIPFGLNMYENLPFWFEFFTRLNFEVVLSPESSRKLYLKGQHTIPSDTVCYPAKLLHGHVEALVEEGEAGEQLDLFAAGAAPRRDKLEKLEKAMDGIRGKFGRDAIAPASTVHRDRAEVKAEQRLPPVD